MTPGSSLVLKRPAARSGAAPVVSRGQTYFCTFLRRSAQRAFIASEIRFRAAADIVRRLVPGGRPRRLRPSRASIAESSLLRSCP